MTLGPFRGDRIRLWRGASGKPLKDALPGETVVIGEGLKDALTAACAAPDRSSSPTLKTGEAIDKVVDFVIGHGGL